MFSFANATRHTIVVLNLTLNGVSGARYVWKQWTYSGSQYTSSPFMQTPTIFYNYTGTSSFTATYDKQYQYSLTFTDASSHPLNPPPTLVKLQTNTTTVTTSTYTDQWLTAGVWTVTAVTWESYAAPPRNGSTLNLTSGPQTLTVQARAYNATVRVLDASNNPLSGATVLTTFVNATNRSFLANSQGIVKYGLIPYGPYLAHIYYQSQDLGTWSEDAAATSIATITTSWTNPPPTPPPPPPPTTTQPSWAVGSTLSVSNVNPTSLTLTWSPATNGSSVSQYRVMQEGTVIATLPGNATSYKVIGLTAGSSYEFQVSAIDSAGSTSSNALFTTANTPTQQSSTLTISYLYLGAAIAATSAIALSLVLWKKAKRKRWAGIQFWSGPPAKTIP